MSEERAIAESELPSRPLRVPKTADLVAANLRRQIIRGDLVADEPLPAESALMQHYNVSRPTLREALRILEHEELIVVKRGAHGGARVTPPDAVAATRSAAHLLQYRGTTLSDVFEARAIIEPAAVRLLADRPSPDAIAMLEDAHALECSLRDDWDRYNVASAAFHARVVEACGNQTLVLVNEFLLAIVRHHHRAMFRRSEDQFEGLVSSAIDEHRRLLDLLRDGDAEGAEAMWRGHIDGAAVAAMRWLGERKVIELFEEE
ncbi:FadR/GntR family transcriptional regulator [Desertimonas flava]|uniref:FadR/GntR family transcriptional regulator n=1 Tax=Desertimonas flava TaxID=2064846 RepID=UPI000E350D23|nr:FCD domain-containing protein [Desertimonas flava]